MRTKILLPIVLVIVIIACSKNEYNTKPTLKITSTSTNVVPKQGNLSFDIQVTDKEGDIADSIFIKKVRTNSRRTTTIRDSFGIRMPDVPDTRDAVIRIDLSYQNYLISAQNPNENDTLIFKFALKDKAKNTSDTVSSERIVIIR
ncbi:MAG TPA: hypothetical protein VF623_00535 [Segetibacter sp.]|jgi:hypothetical protein